MWLESIRKKIWPQYENCFHPKYRWMYKYGTSPQYFIIACLSWRQPPGTTFPPMPPRQVSPAIFQTVALNLSRGLAIGCIHCELFGFGIYKRIDQSQCGNFLLRNSSQIFSKSPQFRVWIPEFDGRGSAVCQFRRFCAPGIRFCCNLESGCAMRCEILWERKRIAMDSVSVLTFGRTRLGILKKEVVRSNGLWYLWIELRFEVRN